MLEAVRDFREARGRQVGVKPAGGIRTAKDAIRYLVLVNETAGEDWLDPRWFRIGASSLLNDLLMQRTKMATGRYSGPDYFTLDLRELPLGRVSIVRARVRREGQAQKARKDPRHEPELHLPAVPGPAHQDSRRNPRRRRTADGSGLAGRPRTRPHGARFGHPSPERHRGQGTKDPHGLIAPAAGRRRT
jgi:hypothetical protein